MNRKVAIVHGAGYVGRELIALVDRHPFLDLTMVTSDSQAGKPAWKVHPTLRHSTDLEFSSFELEALLDLDVILLAGSHGTSFEHVAQLLSSGFAGTIVDLTSDFRYRDASTHLFWTGESHPNPELLDEFTYGLPEINDITSSTSAGNRLIANPGCFATAITLALWPLASNIEGLDVHVTAITGASGSGSRPTTTSHFPRRDGNLRAYNPLNHRHMGEVLDSLGHKVNVAFVPVSGPWTRGIWGTAQVSLPIGISEQTIDSWFAEAYGEQTFVRLWGQELPELGYSVNTPYCDLGWTASGNHLVVVFGLDNLLKGAASQAIQNVNLSINLPEETGLISPNVKLNALST